MHVVWLAVNSSEPWTTKQVHKRFEKGSIKTSRITGLVNLWLIRVNLCRLMEITRNDNTLYHSNPTLYVFGSACYRLLAACLSLKVCVMVTRSEELGRGELGPSVSGVARKKKKRLVPIPSRSNPYCSFARRID